MYSLDISSNGLKTLTCPIRGTKAVTVLILVGAGSRYENQKIRGISHFLEHMFFKGAKKYKVAAEVSHAIDSVGGEFNAFTGKEYAGYYVKLASEHEDLAMDVLSDMMLHAKFDQHEIEKERGVIIEEYNMYQDTPMYQSGWNFEYLLYGEQPLGWDQIGTKTFIKNVNHEDFVSYKNKLYTADNTIVSVAGHIKKEETLKKIHKYFPFSQKKKAYNFAPLQSNPGTKRIHLTNKKTEQAHIVLGREAYPAEHKHHYAMKLLSIILGGNMSSRMFLNIREAKGLSYYIQTTTDDYLDTGIISTRSGVDIKRVDEAITLIRDEYIKTLKSHQITKEELKKAKEYLKGKIILSLEDSEEMAHLFAKQALLYKGIFNVNQIIEKIEKATLDEIHMICNELLQPEKMKLVVIGPFEDEERFLKLLTR